jgi:hypothetical protein
MPRRLQRLLVAHGALVFLAGLVAGFPFAMLQIHAMTLDAAAGPPPAPGDVRGWRMAHLEGVLNGLVCFAGAAIGPYLRLSPRAHAVLAWSLVVTAWGNIVASFIGPLFGGRGLVFGGSLSNSLMYVLFVVAVITVIVAMCLIFRGARGADDAPAPSA